MWTTRTLSPLALLVAVLLTPIAAHAAGPGLTPQTSGVTAGEVIRFSAEGFTPKEVIAFWATAPNQAVLSGEQVPADGMGGTWAITAYGRASATPAVAYFTVISRPGQGVGLLAAVAPETGLPGTTFSFAATGFDEREKVSYWFTAPDGTVFAAFDRKARATEDGRVDISWASPTDAPRGTWVLTMQGVESGVARGIAFHIQ
jgi:hypothetical protein